MRGGRLVLRWLAVAAIGLALAAAAPVIWVETSCTAARQNAEATSSRLSEDERRTFVDTYLTYPEWSIVHAYADFATVAARRGESGFGYARSIAGYWRNLCNVYGAATAEGEIAGDMRAMLHIIGLSFSAEMGIKGLYETTVGRLSHALGGRDSAHDRFADRLNADYAVFLEQTPWYAFPFGTRLATMWQEVPLTEGGVLRGLERRVALTLEYGAKALYAKAMGALAGLAPARTTIRSVVRDLDDASVAADPRVTLARREPDGAAVIDTPRYRALTGILTGLVRRGATVEEIAGQRRILATVIAPADRPVAAGGVREVLRVPLQADPPRLRQGLLVEVGELAALLALLDRSGATLEHLYDY
jgi:hypothetical protein